ncbi:multidrug transporter subunit MdtD [Aquincola sp. MAHUQ-54]|uniref:Multidrug transporter subunit MdtD n=1 Tax=Aquincola agrisoli TaxID=3119538 RepID=A0AAW9QB49_9BURK
MLDPTTRRLLPWLAAIAFFMQTLDATILNTALPSMARSLGESPLRMQSVVVSYMLTSALLIPVSGWLADRFGTRRVFMTAIVLFSLGSLLCALSPSLPLLVASRVVQGAGGALMLPVGRLAILRSFPRAELLKTLAFVSVPGLIGPLVGPPLGGWLVEVASWHWIFLINIPVGVAGVLAATRYMPDLRAPGALTFDGRGFVLFSLGLVMVSLALQGLGERAMSTATSMLMLAAGLAAMCAYWLHAVRTPQPLFGPQLFRIPTFSVGIAGNLFSRLGSGAMPFLTPLFLQVGLGYAPAKAGMSMVPTVIGAMVAKRFAERLISGFGYRNVLVVNTLLLGAMIAGFGLIGPGTPHAVILGHLAVFGVVNSLQFTAMNTLTLSDLGDATASSGNSLLSVVQQLSMSLGVAAAASLLLAFNPGAGRGEALLHGFHGTYVCVGLLSMMAAWIFFQLGRYERPAGPPTPGDDG